MRLSKYSLVLLTTSLVFSGCHKEEGYGGKATIKGTLIERVFDKEFSTLYTEKPSADREIYIQFGSNVINDDDVKTSATGNFEFNYLMPGKYTIYFYSEDSVTKNTNNVAVTREINISKDETVDLGELIRYKTADYDEGNARIIGKLSDRVYDKEFKIFQEIRPSVDRDIYIRYGSSDTNGDDVKTNTSGEFEFANLLPGKYTIYYYTEDSAANNTSNNASVIKEITLKKGETYDLGNLIRYKTLDYDEGNSIATGVIWANFFSKNFSFWQGEGGAQDQDVYIVYNNRNYSETRIRTLFNGYYAFPSLIKGNYKVYVYSESRTGDTQKVVTERNFSITELNQSVQIDTMTIDIVP